MSGSARCPGSLTTSARSASGRPRRSSCSTSRFRRCASRSARSSRRSTSPTPAIASARHQIADLGRRLNVALAQRVQELSRYRSDFFGRLREILATARHPHRRRPLRVPVRGAVSESAPTIINAAGPDELKSSPAPSSSCRRRSRRRSTGCCGSTAIPTTAAVGHGPLRRQLGAVVGARHLGGQVSDRKRRPGQPAGGGGVWRVSAARRSNTPEARAKNRRIELKLTER